VYTDTG